MTCKPDLYDLAYYEKLWLTCVREWTRLNSGEVAVQDLDEHIRKGGTIDVPDGVDAAIQDLHQAMDEGGVVPGVWEDVDGKCYQDWTRTACFARFYMGRPTDEKRKILDELKTQNARPWEAFEGGGNLVAPCPAGKPAERNCCPSSVWADPAYLDLEEPAEKSGWPWWQLGLAAVGIGLTAAYIKAKW